MVDQENIKTDDGGPIGKADLPSASQPNRGLLSSVLSPKIEKSPAFRLYAADFYMDTLTWETDDIGVYFCLLMAQWVNGPLENDTHKLAKIAKKTHQKFIKNWTKISQKFSVWDTGHVANLRMEKERIKQKNYRESQKDYGLLGARKRWHKNGNNE